MRRPSPTASTSAASSSVSSAGLRKAGTISCSTSCAVRRPPEPWPRSTSSVSTSGSGQAGKGTTAASEDIVFSQGDVELIPQDVQQDRVGLLDAVDRPAGHDERVLAQVGERAAVAACEADGEQAQLPGPLERAVDVGRGARGRDADGDVDGPRDELELIAVGAREVGVVADRGE